ncbi:hypothetical protein [Peribacillus sp. Hz7]|uniref:hypothetical protein n=1 Tax=Peribacillus sp. Hz7 TaxID=3344873 RepID=UPI0035C9526A
MTSHEFYALHNAHAIKNQTDANPIVSGNGVKILEDSRIDVIISVKPKESSDSFIIGTKNNMKSYLLENT